MSSYNSSIQIICFIIQNHKRFIYTDAELWILLTKSYMAKKKKEPRLQPVRKDQLPHVWSRKGHRINKPWQPCIWEWQSSPCRGNRCIQHGGAIGRRYQNKKTPIRVILRTSTKFLPRVHFWITLNVMLTPALNNSNERGSAEFTTWKKKYLTLDCTQSDLQMRLRKLWKAIRKTESGHTQRGEASYTGPHRRSTALQYYS